MPQGANPHREYPLMLATALRSLRTSLLAAVAALAPLATAQTVYTANFDSGTAPGFSNAKFATSPNGARKILGRYGNESAQLTLTGLVPGDIYQLTVDVYAIDSWDGNAGGVGPDIWRVSTTTGDSFNTTFSAFTGTAQAYPGEYPGGSYAGTTGGTPCNCGTFCWGAGPTIYPVTLRFTPSNATEIISFAGSGLQDLCDESWGIDNVNVQRLGRSPDPVADNCSDATLIDFAGQATRVLRGSTLAATPDVLPQCSGVGASGPGVWYKVLGTGTTITASTCGFADFDTTLVVACGSCGNFTCVAANDDFCPGGLSSASFCTELGRPYYIWVGGYGGETGDFDLKLTKGAACTGPVSCTACTINIPAGAIAEGEPACGDNYTDTFNGGCNSPTPAYSAIGLGQTISGRAGTYSSGGQDRRDTDWYAFNLTAATQVTLTGAAEFPLRIALIDGNVPCRTTEVFDFGSALAARCETATLSAVLRPGRYYAFVAPSALSGVACSSRYYITLSGVPAGACVIGSGCVLTTTTDCTARGGVYQGNNTSCPDVGYFVSTTNSPFEDISSTGTVAAVTDDTGITIPIGFSFGFYDDVFTNIGISPNGYLTFGGDAGVPAPAPMGTVAAPNAIIAPRWSNLNPPANSVRYAVRGSSPTRRLIVQWTNVPTFGLNDSNTFETVIFEGDGSIEFRYRTVSAPRFTGEFACGVESPSGLRGTNVAANQVTSNTALSLRRGNLTPPVAIAGGPYAISSINASVTLDARNSFDPDGSSSGFAGIRSARWTIGALSSNSATPTFSLADLVGQGLRIAMPVTARLVVTDSDNLSAQDEVQITFVNSGPSAAAGGPYTVAYAGSVTFAGSATDPDSTNGVGELLTAEWDWRPAGSAADIGDGFASGFTPSVSYTTLVNLALAHGTTIYLNVKDSTGAVSSSSTTFAPDLANLIIESVTVSPTQINPTQSVTVRYTVRNAGNAPANGPWNDRVFLSADPGTCSGTVLGGPIASPASLAPGATYSREVSGATPGSIGDFRAAVRVDDSSTVPELGGESDNCRVGSDVIHLVAPDLTVGGITGPAEAFFGEPFDMGFVVRNIGANAAALRWTDTVYLSTNPTLDASDVTLISPAGPDGLAANQLYSRAATISVPADAGYISGAYYLIVKADSSNQQIETNESNNITVSSPIRFSYRAYPDLQVGGITAPATAIIGRTATVSFTVNNSGDGEARGSWYDRVYLSTDQTLQPASDIALSPTVPHSLAVPAGGGSYTVSQEFNIPDRAGTYYVLVRADDGGALDEGSGEGNNVGVSVGTVIVQTPPKADLAVTSFTVPEVAQAGSSVVVEYSVSNQGNLAASGDWSEAVYLSTDAVLDGGDRLLRLAQANASPLSPGASYTRTRSITIPDDFHVSTNVRIIVKVDSTQILDENDRNNNVRASGIVRVDPTPAPNLVATVTAGPSSAVFGQNVSVSWRVSNTGNRAANGSWRDQVVLSRDQTLSNDDIPLGSQLIDGVSPFLGGAAPYTRTASYQIPLTATSTDGQYYIVVRTDVNAAVAESNETDNDAAFGPFTVSRPALPNLVATISAPPANVSAGTNAIVGYTIYNIGAADAPATPWTLTVFESPDNAAGSRRETAANVTVNQPIGAGQSISGTVEVPIAEFRSANVHFSACADTTNRVIESDESDNCAFANAATPYRRPDLTITNFSVPASAEAERSVSVSWTVRNAGNAPAVPYWTDSVYLSATRTGTNLILLGNQAHATRVDTGATYTESMNVRMPDDLEGTYYFVVLTDTDDRVYEAASGEGNNRFVAASSTTISQPSRPNLTVGNIGAPTNGLSGAPMQVNYVITNSGAAAATGAWFERIYASRDRVLSGDDVQLGAAAALRSLAGGESYMQSVTLNYPVPEGQWYIIVVVDPTNVVREIVDGGESDNTGAANQPFSVTTFTATADADISDAAAGTPVHIVGQTTIEGSASPAPLVPVRVHVNTRGFDRTLDTTADDQGRFAVIFTPGPTEGGQYGVGAGPSHRTPAANDFFRLWSYRVAQGPSVTMFPGQQRSSNLVLENVGDTAVPGVNIALGDLPDGVTVQTRFPSGTTITGLSTLPVEFLVNASSTAAPGYYTIPVFIGTATPAPMPQVMLVVSIGLPRPELVAEPTSLASDMLLGGVTHVQFKVRNTGGAPTGPLTVNLPAAPWLNVSTPRVMPSLASGEEATVVLSLTPDRSLALGNYPGGLTVNGTGVAVSLGFQFKAVSDRKGDLAVTVTDEFTYYDEANGFPRVRNATVNVKNHETGELVASATSDSSGRAVFEQLREGYYDVEFSAADHASSKELQLVAGGTQSDLLGFMSRQVVRYSWTVVPTEVQDEYHITIQATFETNVPAPQIIIEPGYIDLRDTPLPALVEYTVRNEGLITARNVTVPQSTAGGYSLIPLVSNLGDLGGGQRVKVPVLVVPSGRGGGCVHGTVQVNWQLPCGPFLNGYSGSAYIYIGVCLGKPGLPPGPGPGWGCIGCSSGPGGPGGPGGDGGRTYIDVPTISQSVKCKPCTDKCIKAAIGCVLDGDCIKTAWDCGNFVFDPSLGKFGKCIARGLKCVGKTVPKWLFPPSKVVCICKLIRDCAVRCVDGGPNFPCDPFELLDRAVDAARGGRRDDPSTNDPEYNYFMDQYNRATNVMSACWYMFGTRPFAEWEPADEDIFDQWRVALGETMDEHSDGAEVVTDAERATIVALARPRNISAADVNTFIDRYNRTLTYYGLGIYNLPDVPQGWNTDFIERDVIATLYNRSLAAMTQVQAEGFEGITEALSYAGDVLLAKRNSEGEGVCATVKIQIDQTLTLTRSAFNATLQIENGGGAGGDALDNIGVQIVIKDEDGNDVTSRFGIEPPTLRNLNAVDGTGTLASGQTGSSSWILLPTDEAAPSGPTVVYVGGNFSYSLNGQTVTNPLFPVAITVLPNPNLQLSYFLEKQVYADDPFTPGIIEPSIPFSLGLLVKNTGAGLAKQVKIASSEPKIIENEKGLQISFDIIGTRVGSQSVSPSLNVDLGDIAPFTGTNVAQWLMTSTLQGEFKTYSATFKHTDPLNDPRLSLIESVDIFGLRHVVRTDDTGDDTLPDFLTDDRPDILNLPDRIHLSTGVIQSVTSLLDADVDVTTGDHVATVTAHSLPAGYFYIRINDPFGAGFPLANVTRGDGKPIALDWNAWQTKRIKRTRGEAPEPQRYLHIFDKGGSGVYTIRFNPDGTPPNATSWKSVSDHGDTIQAAGLELVSATPVSEPRASGIHRLIVKFDEPIRDLTFTPANVSVVGKNLNGTDTDLSGIVISAETAADGSYGVIGFTPALPDKAAYCISLVGVKDLAGNFLLHNARVRVAALKGDASGDSRTNNTDVGGVLSLIGTNPIDPNNLFHVRSDINTDGKIDAADRALVLAARGSDLRLLNPACPTGRDLGGNGGRLDPIVNASAGTAIVPDGVIAGPGDALPDGSPAGGPPIRANPHGGTPGGTTAPDVTIALRSDDSALATILAEFGLDPATLKALPVKGWMSISAPARFATVADGSSLATMLASRGIFASPVSVRDDGVTSIPTSSLIVAFKPGVPASWARQVLAMYTPANATVSNGFAGAGEVFTVTGFNNGYEVIAAASKLAARGDITAAAADDLRLRGHIEPDVAATFDSVMKAVSDPAGTSSMYLLAGDFAGSAWDMSFSPTTQEPGDAIENPKLAMLVSSLRQQGHRVLVANVWSITEDPSVVMTSRSALLKAAQWAQQKNAGLIMVDAQEATQP